MIKIHWCSAQMRFTLHLSGRMYRMLGPDLKSKLRYHSSLLVLNSELPLKMSGFNTIEGGYHAGALQPAWRERVEAMCYSAVEFKRNSAHTHLGIQARRDKEECHRKPLNRILWKGDFPS